MDCQRFFLLLVFALASVLAQAQTVVDDILAEVAEELEEAGEMSEDVAEEMATLRSLADAPLDLSTATEEDLSQLVFLRPSQVRSILRHRSVAGGILTEDELMTIPGLSYGDILRILQFAKPGEAPEGRGPSSVKVNTIGRVQRAWPLARGFVADSLGNMAFGGRPVKTLFRSVAEVADTWKAAIVMENDAGECAFGGGTRLTDFTSAYLDYKNKNSALRHVVVGHYDLRFGQGLGLWTGFSFDPSLGAVSRDRRATGLSPRSSAAESGFLRGLATDLALRRVRLTLFGSAVDADATITSHEGRTVMTALRSSGLHRTQSERAARHSDLVGQWGAYARFAPRNVQVGAGVNTWHTRVLLSQCGEPYKIHQPEGRRVTTLHADHHVFLPRATLYGEVALQETAQRGRGAWGFTQSADFDLREGSVLSVGVRHFSQSYYAVAQQPVCRSAHASGETGASLDFQCAPLAHLSLRASADAFSNRWLRYQVWQPTSGWRLRILSAYTFSRRVRLEVRLRSSAREETFSDGKTKGHLGERRQTSTKALLTISPSRRLVLHSQGEVVGVRSVVDDRSRGFLLCQDFRFVSFDERLTVAASASVFRTDDFASRVFTRQPNVLYDMSFPTLYGRGANVCAMLKVVPVSPLRLWLWCASTIWTDRDCVGSGWDVTEGRSRTTVKLQAQWKLFGHVRR